MDLDRSARLPIVSDPPQQEYRAAVRWIDVFGLPDDGNAPISGRTARIIPWLWQGLSMISSDVAGTTMRLVRIDPITRAYQDIFDDARLDALTRLAAPYITGYSLRQVLTLHALLYGNGIAVIERFGGRPIALHPVHPTSVVVRVDEITGNVRYDISIIAGEIISLASSEVIHLRYLSEDGIVGEGILHYASLSLGGAVDALTMRRSQYQTGALPQVVLKPMRQLSPEQISMLRETWEAKHRGPQQRTGTAILPAGVDLDKISRDLTGLRLESLRDDITTEVAAWLNIPYAKLASIQETNIQEQHKQYVIKTLRPWYQRWEAEINAKLLSPRERDLRFIHDYEELIFADIELRHKRYENGLRNLWLSPNEIRKSERLSPYAGGDLFVNPNTTATPTQSQTASSAQDNVRLRATWRAWIDDVSGRLATWEQQLCLRLAKQEKLSHISDLEAAYAKLPWDSGPMRAVNLILSEQGSTAHPLEIRNEYVRRRIAEVSAELADCTSADEIITALSKYEWHRTGKEILYELLSLKDESDG
jgi:HK97 family phage portal protein